MDDSAPTSRSLHRARICVFAKPPVPGRVNTRLSPALGEEGAARLARAFLEDTLELAASVTWARTIVATSGRLPPSVEIPPGVDEWPQGDGDLGRRVERVLRRALEDAPAAIALGVDSPGLPRRLLEAARDALASADAVIGPADDGGFYTIALTRAEEGLLDGITWSADTTCRQTIDRLRARGYALALLPRWYDVDVPGDLERLARELGSGEIVAPRTERVLRALGRLAE
jgi:rSAM/selenodomain-associated transferase 1